MSRRAPYGQCDGCADGPRALVAIRSDLDGLKPLLKYPGKTGGFLFARSTIDRYMSRRTTKAA